MFSCPPYSKCIKKSSNFHLHQQKIFWFLVLIFGFSLSNDYLEQQKTNRQRSHFKRKRKLTAFTIQIQYCTLRFDKRNHNPTKIPLLLFKKFFFFLSQTLVLFKTSFLFQKMHLFQNFNIFFFIFQVCLQEIIIFHQRKISSN